MRALEVTSILLSIMVTGSLVFFLGSKVQGPERDSMSSPPSGGRSLVGKDLSHLNIRIDQRKFLDRKLDPSTVMFLLPACSHCSSVPPAEWPKLLPDAKTQIFSPNSKDELPEAIVKWAQKRNIVFNAHDTLLPEEMRDVGPVAFRADSSGKLVDFRHGWPQVK